MTKNMVTLALIRVQVTDQKYEDKFKTNSTSFEHIIIETTISLSL